MFSFLDNSIVRAWNWLAKQRRRASLAGLLVGSLVVDERVTASRIVIPDLLQQQHIATFGKSGFGKSSEMCNWLGDDIERDHGHLVLALHPDLPQYELTKTVLEEQRRGIDLSSQTILLDLTDPDRSAGFDLLHVPKEDRFRVATEVGALVMTAADGNSPGSRTQECTRNTLHLGSDAGLTFIDTPRLLTNKSFLLAKLPKATNPDVLAYFRDRYLPATDAMQAVIREPFLTRMSALVSDQRFRHFFGQQRSTFSLRDAMDSGRRVVVFADIGRLGPAADTICGLVLAILINDLYRRRTTRLFSVIADEVQKMVAHADSLKILLSESRKYAVSVKTANQYLAQHPPAVRAALLSATNFVLFRLAADDAEKFAADLGGGRHLTDLLRNLPQRHAVAKIGDQRWQHVVVPDVTLPRVDTSDLYQRCRMRWTRPRAEIEAEIEARQNCGATHTEMLHDWE